MPKVISEEEANQRIEVLKDSHTWSEASQKLGMGTANLQQWGHRHGYFPGKRHGRSSSSRVARTIIAARLDDLIMRRDKFLLSLPCPGGCRRGYDGEVTCRHCDGDGTAHGAYLKKYPDEAI